MKTFLLHCFFSRTARRTLSHLCVWILLGRVLVAGCSAAELRAENPVDMAAWAGWKGAAPNSEKAFHFVVLSDRTGGHVPGEWERAIEEVNLLEPDFVICVGDLIEGYTQDEKTLNQQWDEFEGMTAKLRAPFFYCPGNHDVGAKSSPAENLSLQTYLRRHGVDGKSYYSFDYRDCHFIVLDSVTAEGDAGFAEEQCAWLKKDVARAASARHVFVFWHYPLGENKKLWPPLRDILPQGKTTIFNGHWHNLAFQNTDGFPTYALACTAASKANASDVHEDGKFRMYARVAVDGGQPVVALVPLHEIEPASFAVHAYELQKLSEWQQKNLPPLCAEGGEIVLHPVNGLKEPADMTLSWKAEGWTVKPASLKLSLEGGATGEARFVFKPAQRDPAPPKLAASYIAHKNHFQAEQKIVLWKNAVLGNIKRVKPDGRLDEWAPVPPVKIGGVRQIFEGEKNADGSKPASGEFRAAVSGSNLAIAVDVQDDEVGGDGDFWINDGIELFWDLRKRGDRNGKHGPGTGQFCIQALDGDGVPSKMAWITGGTKQPSVPADVKAYCHRTAKGYVLEALIPLADMGCQVNPADGDDIGLEVVLDDLHGSGPDAIHFRMSIGGGQPWVDTGAYSRFRCRKGNGDASQK